MPTGHRQTELLPATASAARTLVLTLLATVLPLAGCGGKKAANADLQQALEQMDPALAGVNHEITGAMHRYLDKIGKLPDELDELVTKGYLKKLPTPPPGKHFFINRTNYQVEIVE